jgi:hypothetical protein
MLYKAMLRSDQTQLSPDGGVDASEVGIVVDDDSHCELRLVGLIAEDRRLGFRA